MLRRDRASEASIAEFGLRLEELERIAKISRTMMWIDHADIASDLLVSVIMPTHNRALLLPRAIRSVCEQRYSSWELIVVDDGSTDATQDVLSAVDDERVGCIRTEQRGVAAARNRALSEAKGQVIVYLDDDNFMHPAWLRSVVWALSRWPDVDIVYGAVIAEDLRPYVDAAHQMPALVFRPYDRETMFREVTFPDMNVLAHRSGLPEAIRRTGYPDAPTTTSAAASRPTGPMLPLPAIAALYSTSAPERHRFGRVLGRSGT